MAGINGTPVQRLSQTRELIVPPAEKDFLRLVILMGTQKSHSAYRLAWDNSSTPRIPFLPLHRRDLVSAEEGNRTFVGSDKSRINWRKFEVMGEVVVGLQLSQQNPYPQLNRFEDAERLILDIKLPPDEEVSLLSSCPRAILTPAGFVHTQHASRTIDRRRYRAEEVRLAPIVALKSTDRLTIMILVTPDE